MTTSTAAQDRATTLFLKKHVKTCPHCQAAVMWAGGCELIVCMACSGDFCWRCGKANLQGRVLRTCMKCVLGGRYCCNPSIAAGIAQKPLLAVPARLGLPLRTTHSA